MLGSAILKESEKRNWDIYAPRRSELNLTNSKETTDYIKDNKINSVIHCAAKVGGIEANIKSPADFIISNLQIDNTLLSISRMLKVENLLYFGSSCMYPREIRQPMIESDILSGKLEPTNEGYALAKIAASKAVQAVASQDGLNWRVLVPSNLYGPGDNFDPKSSHLIPAVIRKMIEAVENQVEEVEIWGDGLSRREFTYVQDLASFVVSNFENMKNWNQIMNVGIGIDYSVNEYYQLIGNLIGYKGRFKNDLSKPSGMPQKLMDSSLAKSKGWNPETDITSGLDRTIKWYKTIQ